MKMSKTPKTSISWQTSDSIDETYRLYGEMSPEAAYVACSETFELLIQASLYDELLPDEQEVEDMKEELQKIIEKSDDEDKKKEAIKSLESLKNSIEDGSIEMRGDITDSWLFRFVLYWSYHDEVSETIRLAPPPKDIGLVAATSASLEKTRSKRQKIIDENIENFLQEKGIDLESFLYFKDTGKHLEEKKSAQKEKTKKNVNKKKK